MNAKTRHEIFRGFMQEVNDDEGMSKDTVLRMLALAEHVVELLERIAGESALRDEDK